MNSNTIRVTRIEPTTRVTRVENIVRRYQPSDVVAKGAESADVSVKHTRIDRISRVTTLAPTTVKVTRLTGETIAQSATLFDCVGGYIYVGKEVNDDATNTAAATWEIYRALESAPGDRFYAGTGYSQIWDDRLSLTYT